MRLNTPPHKKCFVEKPLKFATRWKENSGGQFWKRFRSRSTKDCNAMRRRRTSDTDRQKQDVRGIISI
jgi:hypothetical protein